MIFVVGQLLLNFKRYVDLCMACTCERLQAAAAGQLETPQHPASICMPACAPATSCWWPSGRHLIYPQACPMSCCLPQTPVDGATHMHMLCLHQQKAAKQTGRKQPTNILCSVWNRLCESLHRSHCATQTGCLQTQTWAAQPAVHSPGQAHRSINSFKAASEHTSQCSAVRVAHRHGEIETYTLSEQRHVQLPEHLMAGQN